MRPRARVLCLLLAACNPASSPADLGPTDAAAPADQAAPADPVDPGGGPASIDVVQRHKNASRDGLYQNPLLTRAAVARLRLDPTLDVALVGAVYAQPLFLTGASGQPDLIFVTTQQNNVYAIDAATGAVRWQRRLGAPVAKADLPCGNIDPLGITGTAVIDPRSRTLFVDAMTTPDGGASKRHLVFGLATDDGATRPGWPIDLDARAVSQDGTPFDSAVQNQRAALGLSRGVVHVAFGGHAADCGDFRGFVVGVRVGANGEVGSAGAVRAFATTATGGGVWGPGGVAADERGVYVATGNTFNPPAWSLGESVLRLAPGPVFSGLGRDSFTPSDWRALDTDDLDIGGTGPLLFSADGRDLILALGKNRRAYLLDRDDLGGLGGALTSAGVGAEEIINAPTTYATSRGRLVVFRGSGVGCPAGQAGRLTALRIGAAPPSIAVTWCNDHNGLGSPIASTSDGRADPLVWALGAEGDSRLHVFDGETGQRLAAAAPPAPMPFVRRFQSPILVRDRVIVAADDRLYAYTLN